MKSAFHLVILLPMWKKMLAGLFLFATAEAGAQSAASTLDVVAWNVEWFGSTSNGPSDEAQQERNVVKVLRYLDADIYGLVEIVDTARLRRVRDSLGPNWAYTITPYGSGNTTGTGNGWLTAQKLAFLYNTDLFSNVRARGFLRNSSTAYTNWASGRFPWLLQATVTINNVSRDINFIVIHGKAGDTPTDYQRRRDGSQEMKDSLDQYYSTTNNIIIGDYNDALNTTICVGCGTNISSYSALVVDSLDADHYRSITLPLGNMGQTTMTNFPNVIDNHVISNELMTYYIPGSAQIRTDVVNQVSNYANTTSDHYPVSSRYNLALTSLPNVAPSVLGIQAGPNPLTQLLLITASKRLERAQLRLTDATGRTVYQSTMRAWNAGTLIEIPVRQLPAGSYVLEVRTDRYRTAVKLVK
jgi:hypothetical protein